MLCFLEKKECLKETNKQQQQQKPLEVHICSYGINKVYIEIHLMMRIWTQVDKLNGEGNGTPLQYSCLENPMDGGAW